MESYKNRIESVLGFISLVDSKWPAWKLWLSRQSHVQLCMINTSRRIIQLDYLESPFNLIPGDHHRRQVLIISVDLTFSRARQITFVGLVEALFESESETVALIKTKHVHGGSRSAVSLLQSPSKLLFFVELRCFVPIVHSIVFKREKTHNPSTDQPEKMIEADLWAHIYREFKVIHHATFSRRIGRDG